MGLFDKIGDIFEDVKDAVVDAAPVLLPIALSYFAPGMSLVGRQALGAGIGTLLQGGKPEDALRSAARSWCSARWYWRFDAGWW